MKKMIKKMGMKKIGMDKMDKPDMDDMMKMKVGLGKKIMGVKGKRK